MCFVIPSGVEESLDFSVDIKIQIQRKRKSFT